MITGDDAYLGLSDKHELAEPEHYVFGHHVDYDSLLRSKEQGCVACSQFDYDRDDEDGVFKSVNYFSVFTIFLPRAGIPRPEITFFAGEEPLRCVPIEMVVHDGELCRIRRLRG